MKISLLTLMLTVSLVGSVLAVCPLGDQKKVTIAFWVNPDAKQNAERIML